MTNVTAYMYKLSPVSHNVVNINIYLTFQFNNSVYSRLPQEEDNICKAIPKKNKSPLV